MKITGTLVRLGIVSLVLLLFTVMIVVVIAATVGLARGEAASMSAGAGRDVKYKARPKAASQA